MNTTTVAIDFGSGRTKVARYDETHIAPRLVTLGEPGRYDIPSAFYLPKQGGSILVGDDAQRAGTLDPDGLIVGLKKELHRPGKIRRGAERVSIERIKLATRLFDHIRSRCVAEAGSDQSVTRCVLTVPSGFHELQREALKQVAQASGFNNIILVDEAIAAAQAWLAENGKEPVGSLLVVDIGVLLAGFAVVKYADGNFQTCDDVLPKCLQSRNEDIGVFEDRVVDQIRHIFEAGKAAELGKMEVLLVGSGSGQASLRTKIEGLNLVQLYVPKQAEFAVVLGAITPIDLVTLRQRIAEDLMEIKRAERECFECDSAIRRLSPRRAVDWKRAAAMVWPEGQWLVGVCHYEKIDGWPQDKTIAARYFQQAVDAGFRKACSWLARCFDDGEGVVKNPTKAFELWNAAAAISETAAAVNLSDHYLEGRGVSVDPARSMDILRMAADGGDALARWRLGLNYLSGNVCERSESEAERQFKLAFTALEKAAHKGGKSAQWVTGVNYLNGLGVKVNIPMAIDWLSKSVAQGSPGAQETLADCYANGIGVQVDLKKAVVLLRSAANGNFASAQATLGNTLLSGSVGTHDPAEAVEWFRKAAERNNSEGQYQLGRCLVYATGVNENKTEGFEWIQRAANQGHAQAQHDLGYCFQNGIGVQSAQESAIKWFKMSADQNCPDGICSLAQCYHDGRGVIKDQQKAIALLRNAAEMGHHESMVRLGVALRDTGAVTEAVTWFRRAAEQNHPGAIMCLGDCYINGTGLVKDGATGFSYIQQAAEMGDAEAQSFAGNCWLYGNYVSQNTAEAVKWFDRAAQQGDFNGQIGLGKCYLNGWGVVRDVRAAAKWVQSAADAGYAEAKTILAKCYQSGEL